MRRYLSRRPYRNFRSNWHEIKNKFSHRAANSFEVENMIDDHYFDEKPPSQKYLTSYGMTSENIIDFSKYEQVPFEKINTNNLFDCFHGILSFIYFYSNNKLNIEEIEFYFSGARSQVDLSVYQNNRSNDYGILNIFDYQNVNSSFQLKSTVNAFFGVTFKRIYINPLFYSISLSFNVGYVLPISFNLEALNEETHKWDVLNEQINLFFISPKYMTRVFSIPQTNCYYSSFRIRQTKSHKYQVWGFNIAAFEIHGKIKCHEFKKETSFGNLLVEDLIDLSSDSEHIIDLDIYDHSEIFI